MRALAVCLVLVDHTAQNMGHSSYRGYSFGWLGIFGVFLFFVHTCLVLMWSLERRPHTLDFYVRRVFRIYPMAMLTVVIFTAFHIADFRPVATKVFLTNLFLVTNLFGEPPVTGVLWSLPIELEMYLLLPMLFLFARREQVLWPFLLLWLFCCKLFLALFAYDPPYNYPLTTIPLFLPGVMAYVRFKRSRPILPAFLFPVLLALLIAGFLTKPTVPRGWIACLIVGLALPSFAQVQHRWITAATHTLAKYSFGIYLLHPIALLLAFHWLPLQALWEKLLVEVLTIAVSSMVAYHAVEHPLMQVGSRVAQRLQSRFGTDYAAHRGLDLV